MLEDDYTWVIRKALRGHGLTPGDAARQAGIPENEFLEFSEGKFSEETARRIAGVLHLKAEALAGHPGYLPKRFAMRGVHQLDLPFGEERVNAWLVWADDTAILFDTGFETTSCEVALDAISPLVNGQIFITHGHRDHVGGISALVARGNTAHGDQIENARPMRPGDSIRCGPITVRACDLSGHADPALGYHIDGLARPVLVTGDALFAGSIGGCATPAIYQKALRNLQQVLAPLPDSTVLLPGHGPATTLGEERAGNPFL
jgi:glyoxylase-like metal-dependent hydrolase (beta-lactamase superfamily II)